MGGFFEHLALVDWPFSVVPRPMDCTFIAGRETLRNDISQLLSALMRRDTSSIQVLWSWLGAGKTHTLYYLAHQARVLNENSPRVLVTSFYTEFPKSAKTFVDLYRSFIRRLNIDLLVEDYFEVTTSPQCGDLLSELRSGSPDFEAVLRTLLIREGLPRAIATRWLRGDSVPVSDLRSIGVSQRINSTDQAVGVMTQLVHVMVEAARSRGQQAARILWLIDEFQRVAGAGRRTITDVNAGLHSLFNACPTGLTLVLSFSSPPDQNRLPDWFSAELRDRIGTTRVMVLPPLEPDQAVAFVREVLDHYRIPDSNPPSSYFPFSHASCDEIVEQLAQRTSLLPRSIMHVCNAVLEAADQLIENGEIAEVTPEFVRRVLADYVTVADPEGV